MPQRSTSAADAAGLERLGLCIAGVKQPSASCGETTEAVAKASRPRARRDDRSPGMRSSREWRGSAQATAEFAR